MREKIEKAIHSILAKKRAEGDVLPYATSIEVAHLLHANANEVERLAAGIEGIERGRTLNHEFYYV